MKTAAIYDIHGNPFALAAVLQEIQANSVQQVVVGGDVVLGPMPNLTLQSLQQIDVPLSFIMGNTDREVLACCRQETTEWMQNAPPERAVPVQWTAQQLSDADAELIANWPSTTDLLTPAGLTHFCHATPENDVDLFTEETDESLLRPVFDPVDAETIVCGHTHMQFDRNVGRKRVINAGSVGMPFGKPAAYWLLVDDEFMLMRTDYDVDAAAQKMAQTEFPNASTFAEHSIRRPPTAASMRKLFGDSALASRSKSIPDS